MFILHDCLASKLYINCILFELFEFITLFLKQSFPFIFNFFNVQKALVYEALYAPLCSKVFSIVHDSFLKQEVY